VLLAADRLWGTAILKVQERLGALHFHQGSLARAAPADRLRRRLRLIAFDVLPEAKSRNPNFRSRDLSRMQVW